MRSLAFVAGEYRLVPRAPGGEPTGLRFLHERKTYNTAEKDTIPSGLYWHFGYGNVIGQ